MTVTWLRSSPARPTTPAVATSDRPMATIGASTASHRRKNSHSRAAMTRVAIGASTSRSLCIWSMAATRVKATPAWCASTRAAPPWAATSASTAERNRSDGPTTSS